MSGSGLILSDFQDDILEVKSESGQSSSLPVRHWSMANLKDLPQVADVLSSLTYLVLDQTNGVTLSMYKSL